MPPFVRKFKAVPVVVSLSGTTARSAVLDTGTHEVISSVDCFILQGGSAVDALTTSWPLYAGQALVVDVGDASDAYVAGITTGGTGSLYIGRLG